MKFMLEGFKELGYLQLVGVNGGCSKYTSTSGPCGGYVPVVTKDPSTVGAPVNPTLDYRLKDQMDKALRSNSPYVYGVNDCDIWVENVLKQAGVDISKEWGAASNNTVADHEKKLEGKTTDAASIGWSVVLMTDSEKYSINHCGIANVRSDGSVLFYQNTKSSNGASVEKYSSVTEFQNAYAYKDFDYYKVAN